MFCEIKRILIKIEKNNLAGALFKKRIFSANYKTSYICHLDGNHLVNHLKSMMQYIHRSHADLWNIWYSACPLLVLVWTFFSICRDLGHCRLLTDFHASFAIHNSNRLGADSHLDLMHRWCLNIYLRHNQHMRINFCIWLLKYLDAWLISSFMYCTFCTISFGLNEACMFLSSAYCMKFSLVFSFKSGTYILNKIGRKVIPCGTRRWLDT